MNIKITENTDKKIEKKLVALEMSENLRHKVKKEAFEKDMSFSAIIRLILEQYFASKEKENK